MLYKQNVFSSISGDFEFFFITTEVYGDFSVVQNQFVT